MDRKELIQRLEIILTILAIMGLLFWKASCNDTAKQQAISTAKTILHNPIVKPSAIFKDANGNTHTEIPANANQVKQSALKDTSVTNGTFVDTAARAMHIKPDQITELTKENMQLKAENIQLKAKPGDTVYIYQDAHLSLTYHTLSNQADVFYHVNIITGKFTPGSWLPFTHKAPVLDFSTDDTRATIGNVEHISVQIPEPLFGFAADVKGTYLLDTKQIVPSIGANIRLGRWHLEDRAYYDTRVKQAASLSYDLFKF